jgi:hypothetical protein
MPVEEVRMTDINHLHFCVYLKLTSEHYPLRFEIVVQKCANLNTALHQAAEKGEYVDPTTGEPVSYNFCRPQTPTVSTTTVDFAAHDNDDVDDSDAISGDLNLIA